MDKGRPPRHQAVPGACPWGSTQVQTVKPGVSHRGWARDHASAGHSTLQGLFHNPHEKEHSWLGMGPKATCRHQRPHQQSAQRHHLVAGGGLESVVEGGADGAGPRLPACFPLPSREQCVAATCKVEPGRHDDAPALLEGRLQLGQRLGRPDVGPGVPGVVV